jgi:oligosaccharyltransferase complex subunit epsilon
MPPKQRTPATTAPQTTTPSTPARSTKPASSGSAQDILQGIWNKYVTKTPQRVKLLDTFMAFLIVVGALQFLYVVLVGNFVRVHHLSCMLQSPEALKDGKSYRRDTPVSV